MERFKEGDRVYIKDKNTYGIVKISNFLGERYLIKPDDLDSLWICYSGFLLSEQVQKYNEQMEKKLSEE